LQGAVSFLVWILYGLALRRRSERIAAAVSRLGRGWRVAAGALAMMLSGVLLLGGLAALRSLAAPRPDGSLDTVPWIAVTLLGIAFVELQVFGAAVMVSLTREGSVPAAPSQTSKKRRPPSAPSAKTRGKKP
ncbi:MAG: hypothetical protein N2109_13460, partial [Fimbriimonadales bacterium]|nr:hypothetical protein [Fimbriimonadales bacterium]